MIRFLWRFQKAFILISALLVAITSWSAEIQAASLRVTWEDTSSGEDGFKIERLAAGLVEATMTVGPNTNSYTDNGLTAGTIYCYRVFAFNSAGNSSASNQPCAKASDLVAPLTVSLTSNSVVIGGTLTFSWSGISLPTATDWIGIYSPGAADTSFLNWTYLSCSQTPTIPQSSGSCAYLLPQTLSAGNYELRFFSNDGYARLSTPVTFGVTSTSLAMATLTASPAKVAAGITVTVNWSGITLPSTTDWIGLYASGAADLSFLDWIYVSCSYTTSTARASGSCPYIVPKTVTAGTYDLRLFANDGYTRIGWTTLAIIETPVATGSPPVAPGSLIVQIQ